MGNDGTVFEENQFYTLSYMQCVKVPDAMVAWLRYMAQRNGFGQPQILKRFADGWTHVLYQCEIVTQWLLSIIDNTIYQFNVK